MNCDEALVYLPAYLDEELDIAGSLRVRTHLLACAGCRRAQQEQLALREALRDPQLYAQPSAEFRQRLQTTLRAAANAEVQPRRFSLLDALRIGAWQYAAAAVTIIVMIGAALAFYRAQSSAQQLIAGAVLTAHVRSLQAGHLMDVPSSDRHTVKPWFQGRLDFSPPVPDLSEVDWPLAGGRLDYLNGRPVAALIYQRRMHNINVFVWPNQSSSKKAIEQYDQRGYQILHWSSPEMTYWVISDLNRDELMQLAQALRGH